MDNLCVVIPYRNGAQTIDRLLDSLPRDLRVRVIDDLSDIPYQTTRENVLVTRLDTRGYFSGAVNEGIRQEQTHSLLILNQDVYFSNDSFFKLIQNKRNEFAMIGDGVFGHPAHPQSYIQGTAMFLRGDAIERVGGFNERDFPLWGSTADYQTRLCRAGFKALPVRASDYGMRHERGEKPYGTSIAATLKNEPSKQALFIRTPPLVSVIITSFNYGRYLRDAVSSLIGGASSLGTLAPQTFQAFEIIIVDDASRDDTAKIGAELAGAWKGIRFIHRDTNGGSAASVNTGIDAAYGKWLAVLDGDDMMEHTRLETLYRIAEQNPHRFIYDDLNYFARGRKYFVHKLPPYDFDTTLHKNKIHKGILFEKSAWQEVGGYPEVMRYGREDWAMNVRLGQYGYCGIHHPEPLYLYRREGQNRSLTNTDDLEWRARFIKQLHDLYPALYAGERTKMCCGKSSKTVKSNGNGHSMNLGILGIAPIGGMMIGQEGMTLLNYLLNRLGGGQEYIGPVTHTKYVFGGKRTSGYVDNRDVDKFLELREGGKLVFARATVTPVLQTLSVTEPLASQEETPEQEFARVWDGDGQPGGFQGLGDLIPDDAEKVNVYNPETVWSDTSGPVTLTDKDVAENTTAKNAKPKAPRKPATPKAAKTAKAKK